MDSTLTEEVLGTVRRRDAPCLLSTTVPPGPCTAGYRAVTALGAMAGPGYRSFGRGRRPCHGNLLPGAGLEFGAVTQDAAPAPRQIGVAGGRAAFAAAMGLLPGAACGCWTVVGPLRFWLRRLAWMSRQRGS